ncbi:MAG: heavy metal translocating P-type ATPase [Steroidobacteraceae bacterium]|nr:heavy metal translocating P-type ATPase [Steroidobacteraceae bacterium]
MTARARGCWHCGEPLPAGEAIQATVAGVSHPVCCVGCRAAAEWIDQLGLADYYRLRSQFAPRAPNADEAARSATTWSRAELLRHVVRDLGAERREAIVLVEGVRCSACVWLIEHALAAVPGVLSVQVNANARRARITWNEALCSLPRILDALIRAGYRALPLDAAALDDARRRESRDALKRLIVAGFGAMQAMMYASALYLGAFDGMDTATRDFFRWLGLLVATPVVFYSARPFFTGAIRALRGRRLGIDVPVALAIALIYVASLMEVLRGGAEVYFDSVSMFVFFLLVGRYLEMRARHRAGDLTDALARLTPMFADRIRADGSLERVGAAELARGDRVHIPEGGAVPADGVLVSERCRVNESLLSGESAPVTRRRGDTLIAGSVVIEGPAQMRVETVGAGTVVAGIVAMAARAATERPRLAEAGERAAAGFVSRVLALAALTFVGWSFFDASQAFTATLAVLVVSCPCAFALAVPAAITRALGALAHRGVLVTRPDAIERLAEATHVVFDKTGTLTHPQLALERIDTFGATDRGTALELAVALARGSRHPVAQAIAACSPRDVSAGLTGASSSIGLTTLPAGNVDSRVAAGDANFRTFAANANPRAAARNTQSSATANAAHLSANDTKPSAPAPETKTALVVEDLRAEPGGGLEGIVNGRRLRLGRADFACRSDVASATTQAPQTTLEDAVLLTDEAGVLAAFHLSERLRVDARTALAALRADGLELEIASGDAPATVAAIAARLGIAQWRARLKPADKLTRLKELRALGARVVAVGDGINDAPVLAGADVSVALASGAELAQVSSDIVLSSERLGALAEARAIARQTLAILRQNQRWALAYNLSVVPLAGFGFIPPWLAALGMSASSLVVVLNAMRIGRQSDRVEGVAGDPAEAVA